MPTAIAELPVKPSLKIPPLAELTKSAAPAPAPNPGNQVAPRPNENPLSQAPVNETVVQVNPGEGGDEKIETSIMPPAPRPGKTDADFAKERQIAKAKKSGALEEIERARDMAIAEATQAKLELENSRKERQEDNKKLEEFRALAGTREKDIEDLNSRYFETHKPTLDLSTDNDIRIAHTSMFKALEDNMPTHIETKDGSKRIFFDQIASNGEKAVSIENALLHYTAAKAQGDEEIMNAAVSTVANILGADTQFFGRQDPRNRLLSSDDPVFRQIESAMSKSIPHLKSKADRVAYVKENEPKLAEERFITRQRAINSELTGAFTMAPDQIAATLKSSPTDSLAIFAAIVNGAPHLKQQVDASIAKTSEALSSVPDQLMMPPLKSNDKVSVAAHRKMYQERKQELSELARFAIIGKNCGPIMAALLADRDEAVSRADAAALNTSPGDSGRGDGRAPEKQTEIPTTIMPQGPARPH